LPIRVVILSEYPWPPKVDAWASWFPYIPWDCLYSYIWLYLIIFDYIWLYLYHCKSWFSILFQLSISEGRWIPQKNSTELMQISKALEDHRVQSSEWRVCFSLALRVQGRRFSMITTRFSSPVLGQLIEFEMGEIWWNGIVDNHG
jgi:hypothetical protein